MKLFKSIDERFRELGFEKVNDEGEEKVNDEGEAEDKLGVCYRKNVTINSDDSYIHRIDILHKASGNHLIQSYQEGVNSDGFNNMVGLDYKTIKLAMKKYRQMRRKYKW